MNDNTLIEWDKNEELPNKYDFNLVFYYRKLGFAIVKKDNGYWAVNNKGERTSDTYDQMASDYYGSSLGQGDCGFVCVMKNGKYGLVGRGGVESTPCIYDNHIWFNNKNEYAIVVKEGKKGLINKFGKEISKFYDLTKFETIKSEWLFKFINFDLAQVEINGKHGLINKDGEEVTPCIYDRSIWFHDNQEFTGVLKEGKKGLINMFGKEISKFYECKDTKSEWLFHFNEDGICSIEENGKYGLLKNTGEEIAPCIYDEYLVQKHCEFQNVSINGKFGIMSNKGEILLPCEYDSQIYFQEFGVANIKKNGKFGLIDNKYIEIVPCIYDKPFKEWRYSNGLAFNEIDSDTVFFDEHWKRTSEYGYDNHFDGEWVNGFSEVRRNNKYGFVDEKGIEVVPCIYSVIWDFGRMGKLNYAKVGLNGKSGYVNKKGVEIIPCVYEGELFFNIDEGKLAIAKRDGKCGVIDLNNREVVPIIFDSIYFFDKNSSVSSEKEVFICYLHNKKFIFDYNGTEISDIESDPFFIKGQEKELSKFVTYLFKEGNRTFEQIADIAGTTADFVKWVVQRQPTGK